MWTPPADVRETTAARPLPRLAATRPRTRLRGLRRALARGRSPTSRASGARSGTSSRSVPDAPYERVLGSREMPGAEWFPGARLNYAEHMRRRDEDLDEVASSPTRRRASRSSSPSASCASRSPARGPGLHRLGVGPGDRVVAYLPNIPETLVAFLATREPRRDLGDLRARVRRPQRGRPLRAARAEGAARGRRLPLRREGDRPPRQVAAIRAALPTLEHVVHVPYAGGATTHCPMPSAGTTLLAEPGPLEFDPVPFDHPLYVLFSSGHDRAAEGDRPRPRRHPARAPEEPRPQLGPRPRRPADVVHDDRLDDVERARLDAAAAGLDRDARRQPGLPRPLGPVAAGRGDRGRR